MKHENLIITVLLSMLIAFTSCSSIDPETGRESLSYLPARCYDFMDMFELNLGLATTPSFYAGVACEPFFVGGGIYEAEKFGMDGRLFGQWNEKRFEFGVGVDFWMRYKKKPNWGNRYLFNEAYNPHFNNTTVHDLFSPGDELVKPGQRMEGSTTRLVDFERKWADITVEVCPLVPIAIDIGFSQWELWDFLFGIFGFDVICDDDWVDPAPAERYRSWLTKEEPEEE